MIHRRLLWLVLFGLGATAGAVLPGGLAAQVPVRPDTVPKVDTAVRKVAPPAGKDTIKVPLPARADSMIRNDSLNKGIVPLPVVVKPDSMKAPLSRAEAPPVLEIGPRRIYDRSALYATGAQTLADLLGRVPGLTEYTTGFLAAPALIASQGDLRRIRIFLDGLELDPMDRRARGVAPVNDLPLHALEEVRIERGAEEVRVYARSWRVDRTDPFTRADISTGDQNSNLYRAFFGRRYSHGEALQVAAEQYTTQPNRSLPSSDVLNVMLRGGITSGPWSADAFLERSHKNRAPWIGTGNEDEASDIVPGIETERKTAYIRVGNGDPDRGRWFQFMASAQSYVGAPRSSTSSSFDAAQDTAGVNADSLSYESQYLVTGGLTRGPFQVSGAQRFRVGGQRTSHAASGRASFSSGPLAVSLFSEGKTYLTPSRAEGTVRFEPFSRVAIVASASRAGEGTFDRLFVEPRAGAVLDETGVFQPNASGAFTTRDTSEVTRYRVPARTNLRAEAGVRVRDLWIAGGIMRRGATTLLAPAELAPAYVAASAVRPDSQATARTLSVRGRLYRAIQADAWAVVWSDSTGLYRPKYQTRSELYIQSSLLNKFPSGNFGILTSLAHEYRSSSRFPVSADTVLTAPGYRLLTFKLEIRIQTAVVSYQFRNLLQERYQQIPGFNMPRQTQFYGVRWEFWN